MVKKCKLCGERCRRDGTCNVQKCDGFVPGRTGNHWQSCRLWYQLGEAANGVGAFVVGGFALSLLHRPDIRTGIASGMWLKRVVFDRASRLELLAVLYPAYWRWSTSMLLASISAKMTELLRADSHHRAEIIEAAWLAMAKRMDNYQVVSSHSERTVELLPRKRKPLAPGQTDISNYHPYSNPSSRRTGLREF